MLTLLLVPTSMVCATGCTIGMIKAIRKFAPGQYSKDENNQKNIYAR